jgi:hypothetical protein
MISARRTASLSVVDDLSPGLRSCVHEFGLPIVEACLQSGVREPSKIRFLVKEIWAGARQAAQRGDVYDMLDWLLVQSGTELSVARLRRVLADHHIAIISVEPTRAMLDASLAAVSGFTERVTKEEKHRRRLRAALRAALADTLKATTQRQITDDAPPTSQAGIVP